MFYTQQLPTELTFFGPECKSDFLHSTQQIVVCFGSHILRQLQLSDSK